MILTFLYKEVLILTFLYKEVFYLLFYARKDKEYSRTLASPWCESAQSGKWDDKYAFDKCDIFYSNKPDKYDDSRFLYFFYKSEKC